MGFLSDLLSGFGPVDKAVLTPDPMGLFGPVRGRPDPLGLFGDKTDIFGSAPEDFPQKPTPVIAANIPKPVMPIPDDEMVKKRRRRSYAQQRARSGRASTIFSEGEGLGG